MEEMGTTCSTQGASAEEMSDEDTGESVQYAELFNVFHAWLKRALHDWPDLAHLFREP